MSDREPNIPHQSASVKFVEPPRATFDEEMQGTGYWMDEEGNHKVIFAPEVQKKRIEMTAQYLKKIKFTNFQHLDKEAQKSVDFAHTVGNSLEERYTQLQKPNSEEDRLLRESSIRHEYGHVEIQLKIYQKESDPVQSVPLHLIHRKIKELRKEDLGDSEHRIEDIYKKLRSVEEAYCRILEFSLEGKNKPNDLAIESHFAQILDSLKRDYNSPNVLERHLYGLQSNTLPDYSEQTYEIAMILVLFQDVDIRNLLKEKSIDQIIQEIVQKLIFYWSNREQFLADINNSVFQGSIENYLHELFLSYMKEVTLFIKLAEQKSTPQQEALYLKDLVETKKLLAQNKIHSAS